MQDDMQQAQALPDLAAAVAAALHAKQIPVEDLLGFLRCAPSQIVTLSLGNAEWICLILLTILPACS